MSSKFTNALQVIKVPVKMKKQIENFSKMKDLKAKQRVLEKIREGNLSRPIITCKNKNLNFYHGQTYDRFSKVPLASEFWESKKLKGDHFVIHKHSENPAFFAGELNPSFEDLGLDERVVDVLKKNGFETPTNIQTLAIPEVIERHNTIISAETGNGKTLSFLAPIVHQILQSKEENPPIERPINSPSALIILPSRELVTQTRHVARTLCSDLGLRVNAIYGGRTKRIILNPIVHEIDILLGSFGAISKLFSSGIYKTHRLRYIVLDEADTLLDDSFNEKMTRLLQKFTINNIVSEEEQGVGAQLILVGATFPRSLHTILGETVDIDSFKKVETPYLHRISPHITHTFLRLLGCKRLEALMKICKKNSRAKIPTIVFCNTSSCSNYITRFLNENDIPCINVNGNMGAHERIDRFEKFQNGEVNFIACTDLVSRGLDTVRAKHVVNFDFPRFMSDYIHRCGRTGRVGSQDDCHVTNFIFSISDTQLVQKIEYAARKIEDLPNVNANIKRTLVGLGEKKQKLEYLQMEAKAEAERMEQELKHFTKQEPPSG